MSSEVYLHAKTMTLGIVSGDFIEFKFNGVMEESYFPFIEQHWTYIGDL